MVLWKLCVSFALHKMVLGCRGKDVMEGSSRDHAAKDQVIWCSSLCVPGTRIPVTQTRSCILVATFIRKRMALGQNLSLSRPCTWARIILSLGMEMSYKREWQRGNFFELFLSLNPKQLMRYPSIWHSLVATRIVYMPPSFMRTWNKTSRELIFKN